MTGETWYSIRPKDDFPETFGSFLLGNDAVRAVFIKAGSLHDVCPYEREKSFPISRHHLAG